MQSSGRGEESPDAYRGVVIPSVQDQPSPYGEHVQPAGGTPWGAPAPAPPAGAPQAADATQMLPPYPAGAPGPAPAAAPAPVPVADATQMLPPYPGGDPRTPQQAAGQGPGPVPPLPPGPPPQQPAQAQQQAPQQPAYQPPAPPVEATQALPLSIFQEQESYGQPQQAQRQPPFDPGSGHDQPPQPTYEQAYGNPPAYGGQEYGDEHGQPQTGPQHDSDYDHLFRNDVPSPAQVRPHIIQPHDRQQQASQAQQPYGGRPGGYDQGGYDQGGYDQGGYGYEGDGGGSGGGRKLSPKMVIGIVVAGCVVAGLVVGGLLNSGGSASADNGKNPASTSPGSSASASSSAGGAVDAAAKQQAQSLDALLKTSGNSRSSVIGAVASIRNCQNLPTASGDLRAAQAQRTGLVTQLGTLAVDKLPGHADLTAALTKAWQASAAADGHYANWADQANQDKKVCHGGHARNTGEAQNGNRESGTATEQKKHAVRLWNTIAKQYGLTERAYSQL